MKTMKKIAGLLLAICLIVPCFSLLTHAANGKIMFTDPSTKVGETLQLKGVLEADAAIEDRKIVMKYDTTMLKFTSGDSVTETSAGQLTYEVTGQQSGRRVEFLMNFDVLKEGTTKVEVDSYEAWTTGNAQITCQRGDSTITIAEGTPVTSPTEEPSVPADDVPLGVTINNVSYTFSTTFDQVEVPQGFEDGTIEYNGSELKIKENTTSGVQVACLVDAEGKAALFLYGSEDATFVPFRDIEISESTTITILASRDGVSLSDSYVETVAVIDGAEFPAWQNPEQTELCVLYAINSQGEKNLYQFDTAEGTYQRFTEAAPVEVEDDHAEDGIVGMIIENLKLVLIVAAVVAVLVLILIIVLSVKLYNRNAELDDLYDEYGIDLDDEDDDKEDEFFIRIDEEPEEDVVLEEDTVQEDIVQEDAEQENIVQEDAEQENIVQEDAVQEEELSGTVFAEEILSAVDEPAEEESDVEELVKRLEPEQTTSIKDDMEEIAKHLSDAKETVLLDDEDDDDFEMDFIDLDD